MLADGVQNHLLLLRDLDVDWTSAKNDPGRYRNPKMAVFGGTRLLYFVHVEDMSWMSLAPHPPSLEVLQHNLPKEQT